MLNKDSVWIKQIQLQSFLTKYMPNQLITGYLNKVNYLLSLDQNSNLEGLILTSQFLVFAIFKSII